MKSCDITPDVLGAVSTFIGYKIKESGKFDSIEFAGDVPSASVWEEFVNKVYFYMITNFVIYKDDAVMFNVGINWLKKQKWKQGGE